MVSGGVRPHSTFGSLGLLLNAGVDTQKALGIPGGTFGIEFLEYTGGATNRAAGTVQLYDGLNGPPPRGFWTLSALAAYTYIPTPGQRPDLPAAHMLTARLVALF